ncbi:MAG: hypothetical protein ACRELB_16700, partial [Polyangiaceae bacterium]
MLSRRAATVFGAADVATAVVVVVGVFVALPARWWPVDVGAGALAALQAGAGFGLLLGAPWS